MLWLKQKHFLFWNWLTFYWRESHIQIMTLQQIERESHLSNNSCKRLEVLPSTDKLPYVIFMFWSITENPVTIGGGLSSSSHHCSEYSSSATNRMGTAVIKGMRYTGPHADCTVIHYLSLWKAESEALPCPPKLLVLEQAGFLTL